MKRRSLTFAVVVAVAILTGLAAAPDDNHRSLSHDARNNIINKIVKAPIAADGDVAGAPTDIVIKLDRSANPAVKGRGLRKGARIKIVLPWAFRRTRGVPFGRPFDDRCGPPPVFQGGKPVCNSIILLTGFPQRPVAPGPDLPNAYDVEFRWPRTIVVTALRDIPDMPGIKDIHLLIVGYTNPKPGDYEIRVITETGSYYRKEFGSAKVKIRKRIKASINVTNAFVPPPGQSNYQEMAPNATAPRPFDFYLWDGAGAPLTGVSVESFGEIGLLKKGDDTVGHFVIEAPPGASGHKVEEEDGPFLAPVPAFVTAVPTGRLRARFTAGDTSGRYYVFFKLHGGTQLRLVMQVK